MAEVPARILVVEDDRDSREALASLLEIDFHVTAAAGISEAERLLGEQSFDVVLTDYQMPGGGGTELLSWMRANRPGLLAIVLTGYPDSPGVKSAETADGVVRVLAKPYDAKRLTCLIHNAAQLSRTNRGLGVTPPLEAEAERR